MFLPENIWELSFSRWYACIGMGHCGPLAISVLHWRPTRSCWAAKRVKALTMLKKHRSGLSLLGPVVFHQKKDEERAIAKTAGLPKLRQQTGERNRRCLAQNPALDALKIFKVTNRHLRSNRLHGCNLGRNLYQPPENRIQWLAMQTPPDFPNWKVYWVASGRRVWGPSIGVDLSLGWTKSEVLRLVKCELTPARDVKIPQHTSSVIFIT